MHASTIRQFIVDEFLPDIAAEQLAGDLDLIASGVIDSLGLLKLIAWIENHFQIAVDVTDMTPGNFSSVGAICSFLDRVRPLETT